MEHMLPGVAAGVIVGMTTTATAVMVVAAATILQQVGRGEVPDLILVL
jgi:hypothetical protein